MWVILFIIIAHTTMKEIKPAFIGAAESASLMVLSNMSNRRERDIREIFHRLNQIDKAVARLEGNSRN